MPYIVLFVHIHPKPHSVFPPCKHSWYMMVASWKHGLNPAAARQPPLGLNDFFQGFSNIVFTFGACYLSGQWELKLLFGCCAALLGEAWSWQKRRAECSCQSHRLDRSLNYACTHHTICPCAHAPALPSRSRVLQVATACSCECATLLWGWRSQ